MSNFIIKEEFSSGGIVREKTGSEYSILLIRIRKEGLEIPKGHIEENELPEQTAIREIKEETNLKSELKLIKYLGNITHQFDKENEITKKETKYYLFESSNGEKVEFGKKPNNTREIVWLTKNSKRYNEIKFPNILELIMKSFE